MRKKKRVENTRGSYLRERRKWRIIRWSVFVAILLGVIWSIQSLFFPQPFQPTALVFGQKMGTWKTFADNRFGFSFQYPDGVSIVDDSEDQRAPTPASIESEAVDIRDLFYEGKGYEAPIAVYSITTATDGDGPHPFSVWIFENPKHLSVDRWYSQYDYYPFLFGVQIQEQIHADKPLQMFTLDGWEGKYHLQVSQSDKESTYVYIPKGNNMMLFVVQRKPGTTDDIGTHMLSTLHFFNLPQN